VVLGVKVTEVSLGLCHEFQLMLILPLNAVLDTITTNVTDDDDSLR